MAADETPPQNSPHEGVSDTQPFPLKNQISQQPKYFQNLRQPISSCGTQTKTYAAILQENNSTLISRHSEVTKYHPFKPFSVNSETAHFGKPQDLPIVFGDFDFNSSSYFKPTMEYCGKKAVLFDKSDKERLIKRIQHVLIGYQMRMFQWSADFNPRQESPIAPVWVHLFGLPLYLFEKSALLSIANAIGNPLLISRDNLNRSNLGYASLCVEMDVTKPLLDELWIDFGNEPKDTGALCDENRDGFWQKLEYGSIPYYCTLCSHIGHSSEYCKLKKESPPGINCKEGVEKANSPQVLLDSRMTAEFLSADDGILLDTSDSKNEADQGGIVAESTAGLHNTSEDRTGNIAVGVQIASVELLKQVRADAGLVLNDGTPAAGTGAETDAGTTQNMGHFVGSMVGSIQKHMVIIQPEKQGMLFTQGSKGINKDGMVGTEVLHVMKAEKLLQQEVKEMGTDFCLDNNAGDNTILAKANTRNKAKQEAETDVLIKPEVQTPNSGTAHVCENEKLQDGAAVNSLNVGAASSAGRGTAMGVGAVTGAGIPRKLSSTAAEFTPGFKAKMQLEGMLINSLKIGTVPDCTKEKADNCQNMENKSIARVNTSNFRNIVGRIDYEKMQSFLRRPSRRDMDNPLLKQTSKSEPTSPSRSRKHTEYDSKLFLKSKPAKASKAKAVTDPNKPKRPPTAFFVFMEVFRQEYKAKHPNNKAVSVIGKAGLERWKSLTDKEKAPYIAKADKRKAVYEKSIQAYNKKLSEVEDEDDEDGSGEDEDDDGAGVGCNELLMVAF